MGMEESPICDKCEEEEETAIHLLTACPYYWRERMQYLGAPTLETERIKELPTKKILDFARETKRWTAIED